MHPLNNAMTVATLQLCLTNTSLTDPFIQAPLLCIVAHQKLKDVAHR